MGDIKIPAANIDDVDIAVIRRVSPSDADEVDRIGERLGQGSETEEDICQLGRLLLKYDFVEVSERLLRCNAVVDDGAIRKTYRQLFGDVADRQLEAAVDAFAAEFGVTLSLRNSETFLEKEYASRPTTTSSATDWNRAKLLRHPCLVEFTYDPEGCLADVGCELPELMQEYAILRFNNGRWTSCE